MITAPPLQECPIKRVGFQINRDSKILLICPPPLRRCHISYKVALYEGDYCISTYAELCRQLWENNFLQNNICIQDSDSTVDFKL